MVTFSDNAKSTGGPRDVLASNQESGSLLGKKSSPASQLEAKSFEPIDEDDHLIHKCDVFIGGGL